MVTKWKSEARIYWLSTWVVARIVYVDVVKLEVRVLSRYVALTPFNPFPNNIHTTVLLNLSYPIQYSYGQSTWTTSHIQNTTSGIQPKVLNQSISLRECRINEMFVVIKLRTTKPLMLCVQLHISYMNYFATKETTQSACDERQWFFHSCNTDSGVTEIIMLD